MLFPIFLFLLTLSPLAIPVGVTVYDVFDNLRRRRSLQSTAGAAPATA